MPNRRIPFLIAGGLVFALVAGASLLQASRFRTTMSKVQKTVGIDVTEFEAPHAKHAGAPVSELMAVVAGDRQAAPGSTDQALGLMPGLPGGSLEAMAASQKLIRTGQLSLEVHAFDKAFSALQRMVAEQGGYIADLKANRHGKGQASGTVVVRIPPARYFATLDALRGLGTVESEAVQTQDVTKAFADLEGRLRVKREMETRLREILKTNARTVQDLIHAERQLFALLEEIEQMEGEKRYLAQATSLSTITLELHEPAFVPIAEPRKSRLAQSLSEALQKSAAALVDTVGAILTLLAFLLPWAVVGGVGWLAWSRLRKRRVTAISTDFVP